MNTKHMKICTFAAALLLAGGSASAQITCADVATDSDCDGIPDTVEPTFALPDGSAAPGDPRVKDAFVIMSIVAGGPISQAFPPPPGSTLISSFNPYLPASYSGSGVSVSFNGLQGLGLNVHVVLDAPIFSTRVVYTDTTGVVQKAVKITESTDTNGTILGNCQWGTPEGLDGCVVYTTRIMNFINTTCPGNTDAERTLMFQAYVTESFLHETGHSLGGLASQYNSRTGGYHYKTGSGLVMEQSVAYSAKGGRCTWTISSTWNQSSDPQSVELK